jgi:hypothetical protein
VTVAPVSGYSCCGGSGRLVRICSDDRRVRRNGRGRGRGGHIALTYADVRGAVGGVAQAAADAVAAEPSVPGHFRHHRGHALHVEATVTELCGRQ